MSDGGEEGERATGETAEKIKKADGIKTTKITYGICLLRQVSNAARIN